jgi:hypothetical protein
MIFIMIFIKISDVNPGLAVLRFPFLWNSPNAAGTTGSLLPSRQLTLLGGSLQLGSFFWGKVGGGDGG